MSRTGLPPQAPSGGAAPEIAVLPGGIPLELVAPAREIANRHRREFPDEQERYGDRGLQWCVYDNQWILAWAADTAAGYEDLDKQIGWLASILDARGYPVDRLARDLELAGEVVPALRGVLLSAAGTARGFGNRTA